VSGESTPPHRLIIRRNASDDIDRITEYIARTVNVTASVRFQTAVADAMDYLLTMPNLGAPRFYQNPVARGLRMFPMPEFRKYLLFYLTPEGTIEIVRVLHSSQDTDAILEAEILE